MAQRRHHRRCRIRQEQRQVWDEHFKLCKAIENDDISLAVSIVRRYPQFGGQLLLCGVQSVSMAQALVDAGVQCNYWTLEGAETKACVDFIKIYTGIRG